MVTVEILVNALGVERIRFVGDSLDDEPEASRIYDRIRHLVVQIDRTLKENALKILEKAVED